MYLKALHWIRLPVGYDGNDNRLRIEERMEWVVHHSDHKYLH